MNSSAHNSVPAEDFTNLRCQWVQLYNLHGFGTVPSHNSVPAVKNWQFITADIFVQTENYRSCSEYGVILPDWCFVIDIDPRNFLANDDPWRRLKEDFGLAFLMDKVSGTFIVRTKRGGFHIYVKKHTDLKIRQSLKEYPGIEFKSLKVNGAYSQTSGPSGSGAYIPFSGEIQGIREAPFPLLQAIERKDREPALVSGTVDLQADIDAYIDLCKKAAPAVSGELGDHTTFKLAARGLDFNLSRGTVLDALRKHWNPRCEPPWPIDALTQKVNNAFEYGQKIAALSVSDVFKIPDSDPGGERTLKTEKDVKDHIPYRVRYDRLGNTPEGILKGTFQNVVSWLRMGDEFRNIFRRNRFSGRVEMCRPVFWHHLRGSQSLEFLEEDIYHFKLFFASKYGADIVDENIIKGVTFMANTKGYHPVQDYLGGLKWDGIPRLDTLLIDTFRADDSRYSRAVSRKTFTGAVARVYEPGCKWDYTLVLEGPEGIGKSGFIKVMGDPWYSEFHVDPKNKDTIEMMRGCWLIEIGEMVAARNSEARALMAFLTRGVDRMRLPYAKTSEDFPRQSIFIGTSNPDRVGYLDSSSENRRYWIVDCVKHVDFDHLNSIKDQIWAEAVVRYREKEPLFLPPELEKEARRHAKARTSEDPWREPIAQWTVTSYMPGTEITVRTVMETVLSLPIGKTRRIDQIRIRSILETLGFDRAERDGISYFKKSEDI